MASSQNENKGKRAVAGSPGSGILALAQMTLNLVTRPVTQLWNDVCEDCSGLELRKIMSINMHLFQTYQYGLLVADVGDRFKTMPANGCPLCQMLFAHRLKARGEGEASDGHEIRAFSYVQWYEGVNTHDFVMPDPGISLCVVPRSFGFDQPPERMMSHFREHGHVFCYDSLSFGFNLLSPRVRKDRFDASFVQPLLDFCRANHKQCAPPTIPVVGLRLLDCATRSLVSATPAMAYVALSYVWGSGGAGADLPPVAADAMQVAAALGFRYLWVDQCCIDQEDSEAKQVQIAQMDAVYRNAALTIVAAAGASQSHGLPGIGTRLRTVQRTARMGRYRVVESLADPYHTMRRSRWFTRAWTFQEGLLSRRCLVFTDDQVYYECAGMNTAEAVACNVANFHEFDRSRFFPSMRGSLLCTDLQYVSPHASFGQVRGLLELFTARKLSVENDSLNAFLGVLHHFRRQDCPVRHLWGVPFVVHPGMVKYYYEDVDAYLLDGMCWRHVHSCWDDDADDAERRPRRRPQFPSWSWSGWAGAITHDRAPHPHQLSPFGSVLSFLKLESKNGSLAAFKDVFVSPQGDIEPWCYPAALLFNAAVVHPDNIEHRPSTEECDGSDPSKQWRVAGMSATVSLSCGPSSPSGLLSALRDEEYLAVILGVDNRIGLEPGVSFFVLLAEAGPGDLVHRCGLLTVQAPHLREFLAFYDSCDRRSFRLVPPLLLVAPGQIAHRPDRLEAVFAVSALACVKRTSKQVACFDELPLLLINAGQALGGGCNLPGRWAVGALEPCKRALKKALCLVEPLLLQIEATEVLGGLKRGPAARTEDRLVPLQSPLQQWLSLCQFALLYVDQCQPDVRGKDLRIVRSVLLFEPRQRTLCQRFRFSELLLLLLLLTDAGQAEGVAQGRRVVAPHVDPVAPHRATKQFFGVTQLSRLQGMQRAEAAGHVQRQRAFGPQRLITQLQRPRVLHLGVRQRAERHARVAQAVHRRYGRLVPRA
ncbi:uncharacterized protein SPSK_03002 [Sporothrix schenckii 1099-18]|uniref:Heterokaryon incompatibility domain-containing protein n=1 Tax=Sporothrix schenckii 1099-18 TaxID=1397361 RepID=A0A0F2LWP7_SPOSC|nr:uncharacterized protein SPSK_03002 [Sporothrix schenckii 1099-18]KJR81878.1 hypothetical protein SPSK_03002 [Sporothrix schenckii 1099-18]